LSRSNEEFQSAVASEVREKQDCPLCTVGPGRSSGPELSRSSSIGRYANGHHYCSCASAAALQPYIASILTAQMGLLLQLACCEQKRYAAGLENWALVSEVPPYRPNILGGGEVWNVGYL
jgi:hypothetical protein